MENALEKQDNESFSNFIERLVNGKLKDKTLNEYDFTEIYYAMYKETISSTEARKRIYGLKDYFNALREQGLDNELNTLNLVNKNGYEQTKSYKDIVEINKDGSYTLDKLIGIEDESVLKDETYLLKCHGYDPKLWQIVSARNSKWNTQLKGGRVTKLYASKINIKPRVDNINTQEVEDFYKQLNEEYDGYNYKHIKVDNNSDNMLVLPVYDLHYGKKSFEFETGNSIDEDIIEKRYFEVLNDIVEQCKHLKFEKVIYPLGSDFFNSDTTSGTTEKGTRQDNGLRWQEMYVKGIEMVIKGIDYIQDKLNTKVEVFYVMGNHDTMSAYHALHGLYCWYRQNDNVNVDIDARARKYVTYGVNLLGFTHGDKEKDNIFGLMQTEVPELWGKTKYREWLAGHIHHETVKEKNGVIKRTVSTITGTDAWHYMSGYVGNSECVQAYVYNKSKGIRNIVYGRILD